MNVKLEVIIESNDYEVDMQYGLETLKGTSDAIGVIAETILSGRVPARKTHKSKVRTKLKSTFSGSYGQNFSIEVLDKNLQSRLRRIGTENFVEIIRHFIFEALYLENDDLGDNASEVISQLEDLTPQLIERLKDPLIDMHQISSFFNHDVKINYRKRGNAPKLLAHLDKDTVQNLTNSTTSDDEEVLDVIVFRFHSKTGNGRIYVKDMEEVFSFGLGSDLQAVKRAFKKKISENLHINNGVDTDVGTYIKVKANRIFLPTGKIIKFIINGLYE